MEHSLAIAMFVALLVGLFSGFPIAFLIAAIGLVAGFLGFGATALDLTVLRAYGIMANDSFPAVPLFIFMGAMVEVCGITRRLFDDLMMVFGPMRGGLALTTIAVCTALAAATGIVGTTVTLMGLIALPAMLRRAYNLELATGCIVAGGTLGILIPPSLMLLIYAPIAGLSIARMFAGAFIPGFLLSLLYCAYIVVLCRIRPNAAPALSEDERSLPLSRVLRNLAVSALPLLIIVVGVLGSILLGLAAPTEAAAVGSLAAILLSVAYGRFTWRNLTDAVYTTAKITSMALAVAIGASIFTGFFIRLGGGEIVEEVLLGLELAPWAVVTIILIAVVILGCFLDWLGIVLLVVPIVTPIVISMGFDPLWFGLIVCVTLQTAFLSPPFATSIFYLKGVAPSEVKTAHIYRGVVPFLVIQLLVVVLCFVFPQLLLWLPELVYA
ncbi:MAG: TRAP transporter large permease subunit [Dehalococcoidia bacterium]|jgi:tripartite ATP-independent transporter DctM subunit|nr:TRAP transporter large permease subunit [Dehalococcoidia bacterium]